MPKTELGMNDTRDPINAEENTGEVSNLMIIQIHPKKLFMIWPIYIKVIKNLKNL